MSSAQFFAKTNKTVVLHLKSTGAESLQASRFHIFTKSPLEGLNMERFPEAVNAALEQTAVILLWLIKSGGWSHNV